VRNSGSIELQDFSTGKPITTLSRHLKQVDRINFSPDGKMLISITGSGLSVDEMKLWDLATSQEIKTYKETPGWKIPGSSAFVFSPDGKTIFLFDYDGKVTPWNLNLEDLLKRGCETVQSYPKVKDVCGSIR
jgi:WD40 repeat protein